MAFSFLLVVGRPLGKVVDQGADHRRADSPPRQRAENVLPESKGRRSDGLGGQRVAQAVGRLFSTRSAQKVHLATTSLFDSYFGIPQGQAVTQYLHPMHF